MKLFCLIIVLPTCSCKPFETLFPQITKEEVQEVKNICSNLNPPPSFVKMRQRDSVKPNNALRSIQYSSIAEPEEVEEYFVNLLTHSDWIFFKGNHIPRDNLRFKKGKFTIDISTENFSFISKKVYIVDCSIGIW